MAKKLSVKVSDELHEKIMNSNYRTKTDCVLNALQFYFSEKEKEGTERALPEKTIQYIHQLEEQIDLYKIELSSLKETIHNEKESFQKEMEIKNKQIMGLIAIQKEFTENTSNQMKKLSLKIDEQKNRHWYDFWKQ